MIKRHFHFLSYDKKTKLHGIEWKPDGPVTATLQIIHGMAEHADRYDTFAGFLADHGICVIAHDHLGHGKSVRSKNDYGFFNERNGNRCLIQDIHKLRQMIDEKYSAYPHFILGHSMGSFLLRQYLMYYAEGLAGAIIMGTGYCARINTIIGKSLCKFLSILHGQRYVSPLVEHIGIGKYNKAFKPCSSKKAWVTSVKEERDLYESDQLCGFSFTLNGYYSLMSTLYEITHTEYLDIMPKDFPLLFVSGSNDPVGNFENGVRQVYHQYRYAGFRNLRLKFYEGARHEVLHEICRDEVFDFILNWIKN